MAGIGADRRFSKLAAGRFRLQEPWLRRVPHLSMNAARAGLLVALVLLLPLCAAAQDTKDAGQQPAFRSQTNLVLVPALVKDKKGEMVFGLQAKDFIVEDDGVEQPVRMDETAEFTPVSLVVAIQLGGAAAAELPRIRALGTMLDPILSQGRNRAAIVTFDSDVELARGFTTNGALIAADLKKLRSGHNGAAILDAVCYSVGLLKNQPKERLRVLLLISETRDHGSKGVNLEEAVQAIADSNTVVYTLAFSPSLSNTLDTFRGFTDKQAKPAPTGGIQLVPLIVMAAQAMRKNAPKTISAMTGGEYELFKSEKGFEARMAAFANHLHNRYLLSFEPKSPHPGLHEVRVRLRQSGDVTILAPTRYWANPPQDVPQ